MTGSGSNSDPTRRGSPADGREHVHPTRPGTRTSTNPVTAFLYRFDDAFSRSFTAMAMAEDGTREAALEMLEGAGSGDGSGSTAGADPIHQTDLNRQADRSE